MSDIKQLLEENTQLKKEIEILQSKIARVRIWMEKEVKSQAHKIAKSKTSKLTSSVKEDFLSENFEEVIVSRINDYFGDLLLLNAPK
jgi:regulator of replication initiation timing